MEEIVTQEFHHVSLFQEHLQILEGGLGTGVLVIRGHIMVHHQDNGLTHAPLPCTEGIGVSGIHALLFKFLGPFFL